MSKPKTKDGWLPMGLPDNIKALTRLLKMEKRFGEPENVKIEAVKLKRLKAQIKKEIANKDGAVNCNQVAETIVDHNDCT